MVNDNISWPSPGETEKIGICDIFEDQSHNISGSGRGSKTAFLAHWHWYFGDKEISIFHKPSRELAVADTGTEYRIFSIDGGHTAAETYKDRQTAEKTAQPDGIIIIDDYFDAMYPGVSEWGNRLLFDRSGHQPVNVFLKKW
jgi:hypothetical protein